MPVRRSTRSTTKNSTEKSPVSAPTVAVAGNVQSRTTRGRKRAGSAIPIDVQPEALKSRKGKHTKAKKLAGTPVENPGQLVPTNQVVIPTGRPEPDLDLEPEPTTASNVPKPPSGEQTGGESDGWDHASFRSLHSSQEESQLPTAYVIACEIRRQKAAIAAGHGATTIETRNREDSVSDDGDHDDCSGSEHGDMVPSDDEPIGATADHIATEAPTWTTSTGQLRCMSQSHSQKEPTQTSESTATQTRSRHGRLGSRQNSEAQCLSEQPRWSATSRPDSGGCHNGNPGRLQSAPASVVTGPGQPVGVAVSQATSMDNTTTSTSILTTSIQGHALMTSTPSLSPDHDLEPAAAGMSAQTSVAVPDLVYPKGRSATLSLLAQNETVQSIVREAIRLAEKHLLTVNGLPSSVERATICQNALVEAANKYSLPATAQQIMSDRKYRKDLSSMVSQRISNEHHIIKKKADAMVPAAYGFTSKVNTDGTTTVAPPRETIRAMVEWLSNDLMFIYPCDPNPQVKKYQANKPFSHPAIIPVLDALFFSGQSCHYLRHQDIFISSLSSRPNEREVPMVMLALVCAAMYTSISKYETGEEQDVEFSHHDDMAHDIYKELLNLLQVIQSQNPAGYHTLTSRIFDNLCNLKGLNTTSIRKKVKSDAVKKADIASMEVD